MHRSSKRNIFEKETASDKDETLLKPVVSLPDKITRQKGAQILTGPGAQGSQSLRRQNNRGDWLLQMNREEEQEQEHEQEVSLLSEHCARRGS